MKGTRKRFLLRKKRVCSSKHTKGGRKTKKYRMRGG